MPKFAANLSMMYQEHAFLDRFGTAAKAGFEGVEFLFPDDFTAADIKAQLDEHKLTKLADAVRRFASNHHALLLANHGPVVAGSSLSAATDAVEELEETAKLFLLLQGQRIRTLDAEQVAALRAKSS